MKKQKTLRIDKDIYEALLKDSADKHITLTELINIILYDYYHSENVAQE